jgi:putative spermidine/putrescine transport system permease protein
LTIIIVIFLILPIFIIIPISFSSAQYLTFPPPGVSLQWYQKLFTDSNWMNAIVKSLQVGFLSIVLSLILGIMAAIGIQRGNFKMKETMQDIFLMPLLIPTIVIAISIYRFESATGLIGTITGMVLAHTVLELPFVVVTILSGLEKMDYNLEYAAINLGASPIQSFFKITLPIIKQNVISAALFAFSVSFDEVVVTLFISGVSVKTLPVQMWEELKTEIDPTIAAISSIIITTLIFILFSGQLVKYKKHLYMAKQ